MSSTSTPGVELVGRLGDLTGEQFVERATAAELRGHRRPRRGTEQHVGVEQGARAASGASSAMPRRMPVSQAMPANPPPASTSPRFVTGIECARVVNMLDRITVASVMAAHCSRGHPRLLPNRPRHPRRSSRRRSSPPTSATSRPRRSPTTTAVRT